MLGLGLSQTSLEPFAFRAFRVGMGCVTMPRSGLVHARDTVPCLGEG